MLFDRALHRQLTRSFAATLVVILTIVLTMMLVRTLRQATRGGVAPLGQAIAAAAGRVDAHALAALELDADDLGHHRRMRRTIGPGIGEDVLRRRAAADNARRRVFAALPEQEGVGVFLQQFDLVGRA